MSGPSDDWLSSHLAVWYSGGWWFAMFHVSGSPSQGIAEIERLIELGLDNRWNAESEQAVREMVRQAVRQARGKA